MNAIIVLKDLINGKRESFSDDMTVKEAEEFVLESIKELEQGQENYNKLWDMYSESKNKLKKAQSYIIDLENQLKNKEDKMRINTECEQCGAVINTKIKTMAHHLVDVKCPFCDHTVKYEIDKENGVEKKIKKYKLSVPVKINDCGYYVYAIEYERYYLRKDLTIQKRIGYGTENSGYFATYEEAMEARNKYLGIVSDKKLNNYSKNVDKLHKKIDNQKNEIKILQDKLNVANGIVFKQINENKRLNDLLDAKELRLTNTIKQYEVSLALNEKTIKEQKVIREYLESKLFKGDE